MKDTRPVAAQFILEPHGWGRLGLAVGDSKVVIDSISYVTNALADFARFGLAAAVREHRFVCRFNGEPTESRLIGEIDWWSDAVMTLRLLHFRNIDANAPDSKGEVWFEERCDPDLLARAILAEIRRIGPEGYKGWSHPFPYRTLAALEAALAETPD
jgi:hypothetical protein